MGGHLPHIPVGVGAVGDTLVHGGGATGGCGVHTAIGVAQLVHTGGGEGLAVQLGEAQAGDVGASTQAEAVGDPVVPCGGAGGGGVVPLPTLLHLGSGAATGRGGGPSHFDALAHGGGVGVLALGLEPVAPHRGLGGVPVTIVVQDGDVDPGVRGPVGVVVALLGALQPVAVAVGVLPCPPGIPPADVLVGGEQPGVAGAGSAGGVVVGVLVHAEPPGLHRVGDALVPGGGDGVGCRVVLVTRGAVTGCPDVYQVWAGVPRGVRLGTTAEGTSRVQGVLAGVLDDHVALLLGVVTAPVLGSPLNWDGGAGVVVQLVGLDTRATNGTGTGVPALGVVLAVEQPVPVVSVHVALAVAVIPATGVVHVDISSHKVGSHGGRGHQDGSKGADHDGWCEAAGVATSTML
mmetsp:Transcript_40605/g.100341  ORF Transcript_40605/g.100341 Transcript_40605/m.100341 type:complete len:404 (+) Transcript_40605:1662-2873(+)